MIGQRIKKLREEKKLTQEQLAKIAHLSQQSIDHYEKGRAKPSLETVLVLADFFNVPVDYLVGRTNIRGRITGPIAAHHEGPMGEDLSDLEDIISDAVKKLQNGA